MALAPKPIFSIQVRALVEFALKTGDLGGEKDFVGPNRALAGIRGHQELQRLRPASYQKEVRVSHEIESEEFTLRVLGRIDGLLADAGQVVLEEIKTIQGGWEGTADPLHWAQAKLYGFMYSRQNALKQITLQLTYLELDTGRTKQFHEILTFAELSLFFEQATEIYLEWIGEHHRWCQQRDGSIRSLAFPFTPYRPGQRNLAVAAYRAILGGGRLFLEAPTGIGKTISVLFPAVKALSEAQLQRIFYLTARTPGREAAQKAFGDLRRAGLKLRTLMLTAKDKLCIQNGQPCDRLTCPLARGYYDRRKAAMREALTREEISRTVLEQVSATHQVCPFELSLDLSTWVDAVICDYNYVFDPQVYLRRHFIEEAGRFAFLIDEAHNLVDRAREMFSAQLDSRDIALVRRAIKSRVPRCAKALGKLTLAMRKLGEPAALSSSNAEDSEFANELGLFSTQSAVSKPTARASMISEPFPGSLEKDATIVIREPPTALMASVEIALKEAETWLARNEPAEFRQSLLELFFRLHSFKRTADLYDERYVTLRQPGPAPRLRLFCLDPSFLLRQALARGHAAIFFSATLTPLDYYQTLLGGSPEDPILRLPGPFPPENLAVLIHAGIRTNLKDRAGTLIQVVDAIGAFVRARRGNYLIYFPSYLYLTAVLEKFQALHPEIQVIAQRPGMTEAEREQFLAAFATDPIQTRLGFALLGGVFGEAIDLVGERLIGAVIVGVGLSQLCIERDLVRDYFQVKTGSGFEYAYMYPGLNRVLQATGRVIRSESDKGVVLLIDKRFSETRYQQAFPPGWRPIRVHSVQEINIAVQRFWETHTETGGLKLGSEASKATVY